MVQWECELLPNIASNVNANSGSNNGFLSTTTLDFCNECLDCCVVNCCLPSMNSPLAGAQIIFYQQLQIDIVLI